MSLLRGVRRGPLEWADDDTWMASDGTAERAASTSRWMLPPLPAMEDRLPGPRDVEDGFIHSPFAGTSVIIPMDE